MIRDEEKQLMHEWEHDGQDSADGRRLVGALGRAMDGVGPDLGPLVAGAAKQGRSLRRRRQAGMAASVAAVAALAVGGTLLLSPGGATATVLPPAAGGVPAGATPIAGTGASAGKVALTGQATVLGLIDALPAGTPLKEFGGQTAVTRQKWTQTYGQATFDDGKGKVRIGVNVQAPFLTPGQFDDFYDCAKRAKGAQASCSVSKLPDGSTLLLADDARLGGGKIERVADLLRADGTRVLAFTFNYEDFGRAGAKLRDAPPLTLDQLKAVVTSAELTEWVPADFLTRAAQTVTPYADEGDGTSANPSTRPSPAAAGGGTGGGQSSSIASGASGSAG